MTTVVLTTADASPWAVPLDWVDAGSRIVCIAAGGGGRSGGAAAGAGGGGGGGSATAASITLTPGGTAQFQVGTGGGAGANGGDTWFNGAAVNTASAGAKGGSGSTGLTGGAGAGQINQPANGRIDVNTIAVSGTAQTAGDIPARLPAALVGGRMDSSVGAMAANVLTAAAINAAALNGKGDWNVGKTGYALSAAGVQAIWDALTAALTTVGSIGKLFVDNLNATVSSRLAAAGYTAPDNAGITANSVAIAALPTAAQNADKLLGRSIAGGADGGRTVTSALRTIRNRSAIAAGTLTVYQEDDATPDHTAAVTTAAGNPIVEVDPA